MWERLKHDGLGLYPFHFTICDVVMLSLIDAILNTIEHCQKNRSGTTFYCFELQSVFLSRVVFDTCERGFEIILAGLQIIQP